MVIQRRNMTDLLFHQAIHGTGFLGATIRFDDGNKIVEKLIRYDSITHTVTIQFTDGLVIDIPDKLVFIVDSEVTDTKANAKRKNKKK